MDNNREEAQQPDQRPTTHYALAAPVYAAVAKILLAQPYGEVADIMEGYKQAQGLHVDATGGQPRPSGQPRPTPTGIPAELSGRPKPEVEG